MNRFFVEKIDDKTITIENTDVNHIKNVLRLKQGDKIIASKDGMDYLCEIQSIGKDTVKTVIIEKYKNDKEPVVKVTIFQCMPKHTKMDEIIQKCVELGVEKIVPVISNRTIVKATDAKLERFRKIAEAAAKQSQRGKIPEIGEIINLKDIDTSEFDLCIIPYELEKGTSLSKAIVEKAKSIAVIIGPEGGFDEEEVKSVNAIPITLGKRILRTETVAPVITGIIMYEKGEMS